MLRAENLGKRFQNRWIFRQIDFDLQPGDRLLIRGRNGSGKSTLLKVIAGLIPASEGKIVRPEGDVPKTIGYAALDLAVYPALTGREILEFGEALRGIPSAAQADLERVGLKGAEDQLVGKYSSGMRARLKLAIALQAKPPCLLLDEPTTALDEFGRSLVRSIVHDYPGIVLIGTNDPADLVMGNLELNLDG